MPCQPAGLFLFAALIFAFPGLRAQAEGDYSLKTGDVVFQCTAGEQAEAIQAATGSRYTHCGVVFEEAGSFKVLEAVQPVKVTSFDEFRKRSVPGTFQVRRLKTPLSSEAISDAKEWGKKQVGLDYDLHFRWDDKTLYCSELVWKIFKKAGVELCATRRFQDYKLDAPEVKKVIDQRYGSKDKLPKEEPVVSPGDLADSPLLEEVPVQKG
ncbi:YiiX/YebB-like N1pC/P60 family cysteine hydrolase [Luteolibacter luteus]|uniref:Peptidoglycan peptidase n=1 Tax=Luteolibacter luteus TaxID=2728835 RepID=A0A858RJE9_9BACT|nr:YiiX/YebB-like N1pC/P60 family cysteine hydrolase [Luteolibacter luteus]QJE97396.1 peptidoglycan peptidase [Luteolibacter luteus]